MKIAGILLIIAQAIAVFSFYMAGESLGDYTLPGLLGRFAAGIVGVILLIIDRKRKKQIKK